MTSHFSQFPATLKEVNLYNIQLFCEFLELFEFILFSALEKLQKIIKKHKGGSPLKSNVPIVFFVLFFFYFY